MTNSINKNTLKFGHVNIRSILPSFADFSLLAVNESFDILAVTETWLSADISTNIIDNPGYKFIAKIEMVVGVV